MSQPALLAVAHGSRNPAATDVIMTLARQVRRLAPVLDVHLAFIGHAEPSLPTELGAAGSNSVIVPLLLSTGYHLTADIADAATSAGVRVADPLGPDELLLTALTARLSQAGVPAGTPVVLAAAGSADPAAAADVHQQADLLAERLSVPVVGAFASAARPTVPEAVAELRQRTGGPVAVASYLLAPGHFQDQLVSSGADWVTEPLGGHPALAGLVIERYRTAAKGK
ncbi:MAG TPA: CbiX/SirB N-terminal domain-containing protein [Streptosporangiaceae bacterium]|jgi:sirohydrochlorin ferrochelatase|nr:CbiX/SirB N-terminal domain-containing protein [Streptosporangiaceae bacterium]